MKQANLYPQQDQEATPFESDAKKIVRKHLEDPHHIITEEELRNIRIGMTPPEITATDNHLISDREESATDMNKGENLV